MFFWQFHKIVWIKQLLPVIFWIFPELRHITLMDGFNGIFRRHFGPVLAPQPVQSSPLIQKLHYLANSDWSNSVLSVRELNLAIKPKPACFDLCLTPVNMTRMLWLGPITRALGLLSWWSHCWAALHVHESSVLDHLKLCEMSSQNKAILPL